MSMLIYAAFPVFILTMILEAAWARRAVGQPIRGYDPVDTWASLTMGVGNVAISAVTKLGVVALWALLYEHHLFDLPTSGAAVWVALFFAEDLCYYAFHRSHHEVRLLWASHVNHHSSTHYNLSTALRQSWTSPLTGVLFWLPLPLLGFHPTLILTQQAISLLYQYWLHTEAIHKMPAWFEAVFNTPSHHRVHHGRDPLYLDRNHAGILIVWDRLFGTFEPEDKRPDYGLTVNLETFNPLRIALHEWIAMGRDALAARSLRELIGVTLGPPGWRPESREKTAAAMRAAVLEGD